MLFAHLTHEILSLHLPMSAIGGGLQQITPLSLESRVRGSVTTCQPTFTKGSHAQTTGHCRFAQGPGERSPAGRRLPERKVEDIPPPERTRLVGLVHTRA